MVGGIWLNSPKQRKGPEQFCRYSRLLPHLVPGGFHWNCRLRWINPRGKGGESLRKSLHPLIIQKCPWLPGEGVCNLPHSYSPKGTGQVLSKPSDRFAKSPWPASTVWVSSSKSPSPIVVVGHGAATCPRPAQNTRSKLAFRSPGAVPPYQQISKTNTTGIYQRPTRPPQNREGLRGSTHLAPGPGP